MKNKPQGMPLFEDEEKRRMQVVRRELVRIARERVSRGEKPLVAADDVSEVSHRLLSKKSIGSIFKDRNQFECTGMTKVSNAPKRKGGRILVWRVKNITDPAIRGIECSMQETIGV